MTKKEIMALSDDELLVSFKATNDFKQIRLMKNELLRRLQEGVENKKRLEQILALAQTIDPRDHPFN